MDIFKGVVAGKVKLHIENLVFKPQDAIPKFHVGEIVYVAERTLRSGPNPEYGPAQILKRNLNNSLKWVYDVEFMTDGKNRKEFGVPSLFLQFIDMDEAVNKPKRGKNTYLALSITLSFMFFYDNFYMCFFYPIVMHITNSQ